MMKISFLLYYVLLKSIDVIMKTQQLFSFLKERVIRSLKILKVCRFVSFIQSEMSFFILRFFEVLIELYYRFLIVRSSNMKSDFRYPPQSPRNRPMRYEFFILRFFEVSIEPYSFFLLKDRLMQVLKFS